MLVQSSKLKVRRRVQGRIGEVRASARWAPRLLVVVAAWPVVVPTTCRSVLEL